MTNESNPAKAGDYEYACLRAVYEAARSYLRSEAEAESHAKARAHLESAIEDVKLGDAGYDFPGVSDQGGVTDGLSHNYPECSGDPACCPENEGYGCCKPNNTPPPQSDTNADGGVTAALNPLAIEALTIHQKQIDEHGEMVGVSRQALDELLKWYERARAAQTSREAGGDPIDMILFCPQCGEQHVDEPQPEKGWTNPPHRSHECQFCGHVWRPADVATNGVKQISTHGRRDGNPCPRYYYTAQDFDAAIAAADTPAPRDELSVPASAPVAFRYGYSTEPHSWSQWFDHGNGTIANLLEQNGLAVQFAFTYIAADTVKPLNKSAEDARASFVPVREIDRETAHWYFMHGDRVEYRNHPSYKGLPIDWTVIDGIDVFAMTGCNHQFRLCMPSAPPPNGCGEKGE